jgi:sulfur carrier protein
MPAQGSRKVARATASIPGRALSRISPSAQTWPEPSAAGAIWPMKIKIELNGEPYSVEAGTVVTALLEELQLKPKRVAVEINQTVVPKADYERTAIHAGDHVEVINFVGGG